MRLAFSFARSFCTCSHFDLRVYGFFGLYLCFRYHSPTFSPPLAPPPFHPPDSHLAGRGGTSSSKWIIPTLHSMYLFIVSHLTRTFFPSRTELLNPPVNGATGIMQPLTGGFFCGAPPVRRAQE